MIKKNILSLLFLFTALVTFNSCEVEDDDFYEFEQYLYTNTWWEEYRNDKGERVYHEIFFNSNHTGTSYYEVFRGNILSEKMEKPFRWEWDQDYPYSMYIDYISGDYSYFGDIHISGNKLFGVWDDIDIVFKAIQE